jgi:Zn-dependent protease with chaperone function
MITPRIPPKNAVSAIRFERERRVFDEIIQNQVIQNLANEIRTKGEADLERKRLLTSSLKITDRLMPGLVRTVKNVQQIINESRNIEVYVYGDAQLNAACADFGRGTLFVMLTSRLVENLTEDELLFVIGHELGHAIYSHHALPTRAILARARSIPVVWTLKLMSWSRCAEISADRVGLLCCQDIDTATRVRPKNG